MEPVAEEPGVLLFRVRGPSSFFHRGSGEVRYSTGIIHLTRRTPDGGAVILKARYVPGLEATPDAEIVRHPMERDSAGFVEIRNPPEELEIRMSLF